MKGKEQKSLHKKPNHKENDDNDFTPIGGADYSVRELHHKKTHLVLKFFKQKEKK
jgi:hypothetical protein